MMIWLPGLQPLRVGKGDACADSLYQLEFNHSKIAAFVSSCGAGLEGSSMVFSECSFK